MKLTAKMIREAADGIDSFAQIRVRSYSGRGMNGRECMAIVTPNAGDLVRFGMSLAYVVAEAHSGSDLERSGGVTAADVIDDAISQLPVMRTDSMAGDLVAYWPAVPVEEAIS